VNTVENRPSGFHAVSIGHLVMGIAFLGIVGVWGLIQTDTVTGDDIRWLMPIPWVLAGVVGLAATAITGSRRHAVRQTGWAGESSQRGWVGATPEVPGASESESQAPETQAPGTQASATHEPDEPVAAGSPTADLPKYPETSRAPEAPEAPEEKP
jgi:hypothetical protein